jgi:hypothetical protein
MHDAGFRNNIFRFFALQQASIIVASESTAIYLSVAGATSDSIASL